MLLAERGLGVDIGLNLESVSALLAVAKLGLDTYKTISSQQLAREANRIEKLGIEVERQIALEKLSYLKLQEELAAAQSANTTSSLSTGAYLAIGAFALVALFAIGRR